MKKIHFFFVALLLLVCSMHAQHAVLFRKSLPFVPKDHVIMDTLFNDYTGDSIVDVVLVAKKVNESENPKSLRPLIILAGTKAGALKLYARNDSVVLCKGCGAGEPEPFLGLHAAPDGFVVSMRGGSQWKWTKSVTFGFSPSMKNVVMISDEGVVYKETNTQNVQQTVYDRDSYGKVKFVNYRNTHLR